MSHRYSTYDALLQAPAAIPAGILAEQGVEYFKTGKWPVVTSQKAFDYFGITSDSAKVQNLIEWFGNFPLWLTTLGLAGFWAILFSILVKRPGSLSQG